MLDFQPIEVKHKDLIQSFFDKNTFRGCDFSFSNIFCWRHHYKTTFAIESDALYFRFHIKGEEPCYLFPLGEKDIKETIGTILADARERESRFQLHAVTPEMYDALQEVFPERFLYQKNRDWYEYIYSSQDLIQLSGKRFQTKRNHINKFKRMYQWEYLPITREIIPDCLELYKRWCKENGGCEEEKSLVEERISTMNAFEHYEQLGLVGGALKINGELLAYSYGQPISSDTFGVHAEKCLYEIDGGFSMINQQFAEHNCSGYSYINREEDLGYESLRQSKLSYHPAFLLEKGIVTLK